MMYTQNQHKVTLGVAPVYPECLGRCMEKSGSQPREHQIIHRKTLPLLNSSLQGYASLRRLPATPTSSFKLAMGQQ